MSRWWLRTKQNTGWPFGIIGTAFWIMAPVLAAVFAYLMLVENGQ